MVRSVYSDMLVTMKDILNMTRQNDTETRGRCLECGRILPPGRTDMLFCSTSCKSRYHYKKEGKEKNARARTIRILDRNHTILSLLLDKGLTAAELSDLIHRGFNPGYVTSHCRIGSHNEYRCYDIKYFMSERRIFCLDKSE